MYFEGASEASRAPSGCGLGAWCTPRTLKQWHLKRSNGSQGLPACPYFFESQIHPCLKVCRKFHWTSVSLPPFLNHFNFIVIKLRNGKFSIFCYCFFMVYFTQRDGLFYLYWLWTSFKKTSRSI